MYLQAHMSRRHAQMPFINPQSTKPSNEFENEFEKIKEKLRQTENELQHERNARLNSNLSDINKDDGVFKRIEEWKEKQNKLHQQDIKSMEDKFLKEIEELKTKNLYAERALIEFEKKLGKQSHVGKLEDDVDEAISKQQREYAKLKHQLDSNVSFIFNFIALLIVNIKY